MRIDRRSFIHMAAPLAAQPLLFAAAGARPLTEWYHTYALTMPPGTTPETGLHGVTGSSVDILGIFNLSLGASKATITHYFDDLPPKQFTRDLPARSPIAFLARELPESEMPKKKPYAVRVKSPAPVIVQATRVEHEDGVKPPVLAGNSFLSRLAYPGPLGKAETMWAYADGFVERRKDKQGYEDWEWLSVLNPNPSESARLRITFNYADAQLLHEIIVPAERMRVIDLYRLPIIRDTGMFGVVVESSVPVVVEQIRRSFHTGNRAPNGMWILQALPVGEIGVAMPVARAAAEPEEKHCRCEL